MGNNMKRLLLAIALIIGASNYAYAQGTQLCFTTNGNNCIKVGDGIAANSGAPLPVTLYGSSILPSGAATSALQVTGNTSLQTLVNQAVPSCSATPVVSASAEASHVLKNTSGSLCGVYATNIGSLPGFLVVLNQTTLPISGNSLTPLACVPIPVNGYASISFGTGFSSTYSTGIVAAITTATNCFLYNNGTTAFIAGQVL